MGLFGLGFPELAVIAGVAVLIFGKLHVGIISLASARVWCIALVAASSSSSSSSFFFLVVQFSEVLKMHIANVASFELAKAHDFDVPAFVPRVENLRNI